MKTYPLHSISLEQAKQLQFKVIDAVTRNFQGEEVLSLGDLGVVKGLNKPRCTVKVEKVFADTFDAPAALLVRGSGTGAIRWALTACLKPGDAILVHTSPIYTTTQVTIDAMGLKPIRADFNDLEQLKAVCAQHKDEIRGALVQLTRQKPEDRYDYKAVIAAIKAALPGIPVVTDDNYAALKVDAIGCQAGADLVVGSLIKNPGGGIAPTGGYIAGRKDLVELCAYRLNAPGLGKELGCTLETPRDMYLGFYYAPGVVCEAIKTAIYAQCLLELLDKNPIPRYCDDHNDIVTCFDAGTAEALIGFCQGIQAASPVDSYAAPEPSPEPGYTDEVVMASGSFTQGSTIELSCDGPLRAPYTCYLQGGLNFAASRAGVLLAVQKAYFE